MGKIKNLVRGAVLTGIIAGAGSNTPVRAQIPVTDVAHIIQSIVNTLENLMKWYQYISTFNRYYSMYQAVSHGNYSMMPWTEILDLTNSPWFDGVEGIEDVRQLCTVKGMTVTQLEQIYHEYEIFQRMKNDPLYAKSRAFAAYQKLMQETHTRAMRRKVAVARMMQRHQDENRKLTAQVKSCRDEIARLSTFSEPPASVIAALQGKLQAIQAKMEAGAQGLQDQLTLMKDQEAYELSEARSKVMMEVWNQHELSAEDRRKYWATALGGGR